MYKVACEITFDLKQAFHFQANIVSSYIPVNWDDQFNLPSIS